MSFNPLIQDNEIAVEAVLFLPFPGLTFGPFCRSIRRRVEDRHLPKAIYAFLPRRSPESEKNPCCTTKLNSRFAIGTFLWLKADTRERELPSRIPHAQSTFRRVPINLRRTERAAPVVPQFVGKSCNLFVRVFFLHVFFLVGCQARVNGAAYQPSNLPASQ
jgi:hypothetical protein